MWCSAASHARPAGRPEGSPRNGPSTDSNHAVFHAGGDRSVRWAAPTLLRTCATKPTESPD